MRFRRDEYSRSGAGGCLKSVELATVVFREGIFQVVDEVPGGIPANEVYRRSSETSTGHACSQQTALVAEITGGVDQRIEFFATHVEVVAQRVVPLAHDPTDGGDIVGFERNRELVNASHLGHRVAGTA